MASKTAIKGPRVIAKTKCKRLAAMQWANEKECQLIKARGGKWRDGSYGAAQTLNEKPGGRTKYHTRQPALQYNYACQLPGSAAFSELLWRFTLGTATNQGARTNAHLVYSGACVRLHSTGSQGPPSSSPQLA